MSALDLIKAQQALAAAQVQQQKELRQRWAEERARAFAPVKAFVEELAAAGAIYKADGYTPKLLAEILKNNYPVSCSPDCVRFCYIRYKTELRVTCPWPNDEGKYPGASGFQLQIARDYPGKSDPVKYYPAAADLITALAAEIQHAIVLPADQADFERSLEDAEDGLL